MFFKINIDNLDKTVLKNVTTILTTIMLLLFPLTGVIGGVQAANDNKVIPRELAMFASLAYADLENIHGYNVIVNGNNNGKTTLNVLTKITKDDLTFMEMPIVSDAQLASVKTKTSLLGLEKKSDENTYDYLFSGLASTNEVLDWKLVNYAKFNTTVFKGMAEFTAMTFKKDNNIVIAYRGTDFDDIGDWAQDLFYGLVNYAGQESVAQDYARLVAEHYAKDNNNINIYVTGHSLGGYLAQIGGAELAGNPEYMDNLKEIIYFNGMGLKFWSNIKAKLTPDIITKLKMNKAKENEIKNDNSRLNKIQDNAKIVLTNWKNKGGKLIVYSINGDLISALGTHVGDQIGINAHNVCINHHKGNQETAKNSIKLVLRILQPFLNKDIAKFVDVYKPDDLIGFVWMVHETDSFLGMLPYADGTLPINISVSFDMPTQVKYKKTATATLKVMTTGGQLLNSNLNKDNFKVSHKNRIEINSISRPTVQKTSSGYMYLYKITLKGKIIIGNSTISVKPNVLRVLPFKNTINNQALNLLTSNEFISSEIRTKLR